MRLVLTRLFAYRRYCYNQALEIWNEMYDASVVMADKTLRPNERKVRNELVNDKQDWQYAQSARVLQLAVNDLARAWQNYFDPQMPNHAQPQFKSKKRSKNSFKTDRAKVIGNKLRLDNLHMRMNKHLAKNLHRSLFGKFKVLMQYKRAWHGVKLIMADRFYPSTQRCSKCGFVKTGADKVGLAGNQIHRTGHDDYVCYECGAVMHRDQNAVENLIQYAEIN